MTLPNFDSPVRAVCTPIDGHLPVVQVHPRVHERPRGQLPPGTGRYLQVPRRGARPVVDHDPVLVRVLVVFDERLPEHLAVELGDVTETIRRAEQVNTTPLPADLLERRAQVFIDLGRAYVQRRDDAAATTVFRQAEELAPEEVHYSVPVREALREMLRREHRYTTPELRPLARRTGIIS